MTDNRPPFRLRVGLFGSLLIFLEVEFILFSIFITIIPFIYVFIFIVTLITNEIVAINIHGTPKTKIDLIVNSGTGYNSTFEAKAFGVYRLI